MFFFLSEHVPVPWWCSTCTCGPKSLSTVSPVGSYWTGRWGKKTTYVVRQRQRLLDRKRQRQRLQKGKDKEKAEKKYMWINGKYLEKNTYFQVSDVFQLTICRFPPPCNPLWNLGTSSQPPWLQMGDQLSILMEEIKFILYLNCFGKAATPVHCLDGVCSSLL